MKTRNLITVLSATFLLVSNALFSQQVQQKPLKPFQLSIFPVVGTEGAQALNYRYQFSLNLFAGINGGIEGLEAGGFLNINNGPVTGAQFSGFGNVVRGNVEGFQGAGFMNVVNGSSRAFHGAGFVNSVSGSTEGVIGAGFVNVVGGNSTGISGAGFANVNGGSFEGVQGAGFINVNGGNTKGIAGAGFMNVNGGNTKGVAGAGFMNVNGGNLEGVQGAGFANVNGNHVKGLQAAGFMNAARDLKGAQVSGFLNVAKRVEGVQIGFLNIADTVDGVPIGFLSIVRKGAYRQIELSGSDVIHTSLALKLGVPVFYNIFSFNMRPFSTERVRGFGYGIGSEIGLTEKSALQIEAHTMQLRNDWKWNDTELDLLSELRLTASVDLPGRLQLFAGPVLYNKIYKDIPSRGITGFEVSTYSFGERHWNDYTSKWWIGARGGLRLNVN